MVLNTPSQTTTCTGQCSPDSPVTLLDWTPHIPPKNCERKKHVAIKITHIGQLFYSLATEYPYHSLSSGYPRPLPPSPPPPICTFNKCTHTPSLSGLPRLSLPWWLLSPHMRMGMPPLITMLLWAVASVSWGRALEGREHITSSTSSKFLTSSRST